MKASRLCNYDAELFSKVKESVSMQQVAEWSGVQVNSSGLCLCPFHKDRHPSMKIYPNGKGFFCFVCGAGGDQISYVAKLHGIKNYEAAKEIASAFAIPIAMPQTYREKRAAEQRRKQRAELLEFIRQASMWVQMYIMLLCEARDPEDPHFMDRINYLDWAEYIKQCIENDPQEVMDNGRSDIAKIRERVIKWHEKPEVGRADTGGSVYHNP